METILGCILLPALDATLTLQFECFFLLFYLFLLIRENHISILVSGLVSYVDPCVGSWA